VTYSIKIAPTEIGSEDVNCAELTCHI